MKFALIIPEKNVMVIAMRLVKEAQVEIFATMDVDEEYVSPLPNQYHELLNLKGTKGVKIVRYGYGNKRSFTAIKKRYSNMQFLYKGSFMHYQRMLVTDRKKALFRLGQIVYFSDFNPLIDALIHFAKRKRI